MTNHDEKILTASDKLYDSIRDYVGTVLGNKVYTPYMPQVYGDMEWADDTKDICDTLFDMIETWVEEYEQKNNK